MPIYKNGKMVDSSNYEPSQMKNMMGKNDVLIMVDYGHLLWDRDGVPLIIKDDINNYAKTLIETVVMLYDNMSSDLAIYSIEELIEFKPHYKYVVASIENMINLVAIVLSNRNYDTVYVYGNID